MQFNAYASNLMLMIKTEKKKTPGQKTSGGRRVKPHGPLWLGLQNFKQRKKMTGKSLSQAILSKQVQLKKTLM